MITYRNAVATDAQALTAFARASFVETFGHLYPPEDLASFLAEKYDAALVRADIEAGKTHYRLAFDGDELIGYNKVGGDFDLPVEHEPSAVELHRLYVHTRVKGQGVAKTLMDEALDWARARGAAAMYLSVWENNFRAQAFYNRYGFEHIGEHGFMVGRTRDRDFIWRLPLG
ncbi:MAG TPA: GNAT family N-acetyltransferase [Caulobacterales bacterium]|nr:GNAT family N-acetyltransferase [Caulobacterales bacterium]